MSSQVPDIKWKLANNWPCKKCHKKPVVFYTDETYDGAYDRHNYLCKSCGYEWRIVLEYD